MMLAQQADGFRKGSTHPTSFKPSRPLKPARYFRSQFLGTRRRPRRSGAQPRQDILDPFGFENLDRQRRPNELGSPHMRKQREQRLPEAVDIGQQDRLGVAAPVVPRQLSA